MRLRATQHREPQEDHLSALKTDVITAWWAQIGIAVMVVRMMMMTMMIAVLLLLTHSFSPLLHYFRAIVEILQSRHRITRGNKPTVLIKVLMCGFETLRQNPMWDLLLSQLLADNIVISSEMTQVNKAGLFCCVCMPLN